MAKLIGAKFGDIILNKHLRADNPERCGVFVREKFGVITLTDTQDKFWTVSNDVGANFEVNGFIDFDEYLKDHNKKLKAVSNAT